MTAGLRCTSLRTKIRPLALRTPTWSHAYHPHTTTSTGDDTHAHVRRAATHTHKQGQRNQLAAEIYLTGLGTPPGPRVTRHRRERGAHRPRPVMASRTATTRRRSPSSHMGDTHTRAAPVVRGNFEPSSLSSARRVVVGPGRCARRLQKGAGGRKRQGSTEQDSSSCLTRDMYRVHTPRHSGSVAARSHTRKDIAIHRAEISPGSDPVEGRQDKMGEEQRVPAPTARRQTGGQQHQQATSLFPHLTRVRRPRLCGVTSSPVHPSGATCVCPVSCDGEAASGVRSRGGGLQHTLSLSVSVSVRCSPGDAVGDVASEPPLIETRETTLREFEKSPSAHLGLPHF